MCTDPHNREGTRAVVMDIIHIRRPQQIEQSVNGHRLFLDDGVYILHPTPDGLINGSKPAKVILEYTEPHEELCGFYFPKQPMRGDLP